MRQPKGTVPIFLALAGAALVAQQQAAPTGDPLIQDLKWRNIGNANLIGRISAIDALESDFTHVVVGSASGGVFKSTNAGTTWTPIFDNYPVASIGDVKIFQKNPDIIWVGTGEECGRNTAAWGDGVYKSTDGGKTFVNVGLKDTYNIGEIVLHPTDPNIVYVAAIGNIWGPIGDRGLFKSADGGKTWAKLKNGLPPEDNRTGAIDAVMDPRDPNTLYVAFWARHRMPWALNSGGPNGGVFKTTDGGKAFRKLTKGLPPGDSGKIGLAVSRSNPRVVMAHYEHGFQPPQNSPDFKDLSKLGAGIYRSEDGGETWRFVNRYISRPFYYQHIAVSPFDDKSIYSFTIRFQRSEDGGRTLRPANGGGHCWHALWLDPHNKKRFWVGSDGGLSLTHDDGENFQRFENLNVTQYYIVAADMRDPYWVYGGLQDAGSSGGPSATRAQGIYTSDWFNLSGGDGYHAAVDPSDWRWVYTESQPGTNGGNVGRMNVETRERVSIRPQKGRNIVNYDQYITAAMEKMAAERNWGAPDEYRPGQGPQGGPGFGGGPGGGGPGGGGPGGGQQGPRMGPFRYNWSTPFILSPHNPRTIYLGANHLFRSVDRGDTWTIISPDLTKNDPKKTIRKSGGLTPDEDPGGGAEYHCTIVTIAESPLEPGLIWIGTDDGNVQVTRNGGATWTNVATNIPGLPQNDLWISRVEASHFDRGTAYVSVDGHRSALFKPWAFKTTDYGKTWTSISSTLPDSHPVYVVKEDRKNPTLLFAGTEFAVFYSINGGQAWSKLNNNLPTVAVYDLIVHPRDNDLIVATHGRGFWIMDDITPLQQLTTRIQTSEAHLFDNRLATQWLNIQPHGTGGSFGFRGENPPRGAMINYYLGPSAAGDVTFEIANFMGSDKRTYKIPAKAGVNRLLWDMRYDPTSEQVKQFEEFQRRRREAGFGPAGPGGPGGGFGGPQGPQGNPAPAGEYRVTMTVNGKSYTTQLTVRRDPMLDGSRRVTTDF
jgi:photosystem II stability/assembly factor-like uncharacterized protein